MITDSSNANQCYDEHGYVASKSSGYYSPLFENNANNFIENNYYLVQSKGNSLGAQTWQITLRRS